MRLDDSYVDQLWLSLHAGIGRCTKENIRSADPEVLSKTTRRAFRKHNNDHASKTRARRNPSRNLPSDRRRAHRHWIEGCHRIACAAYSSIQISSTGPQQQLVPKSHHPKHPITSNHNSRSHRRTFALRLPKAGSCFSTKKCDFSNTKKLQSGESIRP